MAWPVIDRTKPVIPADAAPLLTDAVREKIRGFFPRYETRRAALLPALHVVQDALGHVSLQAMREVAELLDLPPSQVMDTLSFYTHFWSHPKGEKVVVLCRSLSCQLMGGTEVQQAIEKQLGVSEHGTSADGRYSFVTEECLAACDFAPCLLVNEKMHKCVKPSDVSKLLADASNAALDMPRSDLYDAPREAPAADAADLPKTSDVQEMKDG